jgi:hypothetical protein
VQTKTLKALYSYLTKNKIEAFDLNVNDKECYLTINNFSPGREEIDELTIMEESVEDIVFIKSSVIMKL